MSGDVGTIQCPNCGRSVLYAPSMAGKVKGCPSCKRDIHIPPPAPPRPVEQAQDVSIPFTEVPATTEADQSKPAEVDLTLIVMGSIGLLFFLCITIGVMFYPEKRLYLASIRCDHAVFRTFLVGNKAMAQA